ncbi:MAG: MTH1187 family thiamine-binding protein [Methanotrichaceae archaeon]|nr:MTH1187 family thiamine-binding protein [Methanotrichaceae archaeon]
MIVADFSLVPMGTGTSAGKYIRSVYEMLEESGVKFMPGPNSTSVEVKTFEELFDIIRRSNEKLKEMGVKRVITSVGIDYRLDKEISIESKMGASKIK